eukprot:2395805-Rhodomonas_salina.3
MSGTEVAYAATRPHPSPLSAHKGTLSPSTLLYPHTRALSDVRYCARGFLGASILACATSTSRCEIKCISAPAPYSLYRACALFDSFWLRVACRSLRAAMCGYGTACQRIRRCAVRSTDVAYGATWYVVLTANMALCVGQRQGAYRLADLGTTPRILGTTPGL